mgnify:FL=1
MEITGRFTLFLSLPSLDVICDFVDIHRYGYHVQYDVIDCLCLLQGHSPAGGCLLSILCDYRVMADGKYTIGLNETLLVRTRANSFPEL